MTAETGKAPARATQSTRKPAASWTLKGVSKQTRDAAARAAKEEGIPIGKWVDRALSQAAKSSGEGVSTSSALHDLRSRAEPTLDQLRSRTDETLERWRSGLIEQLGNTLVSVQRLQRQLLGREDEDTQPSPKAPAVKRTASRDATGGTADDDKAKATKRPGGRP